MVRAGLTCLGLYATVTVTLALAAGPDGATNSRHARFAKGVNKPGIEEEEHETDN